MKKTAPSFHFGAKTRQDRYDYALMCDDEKEWRMYQRKMLAKRKRREMTKKLKDMGEHKRMFGFDPLDLNFSIQVRNSKLKRVTNESKAWHNRRVETERKDGNDGKGRESGRSKKQRKRKKFKMQKSAMRNLSRPKHVKSLPSLSYHAAMMRLMEQQKYKSIEYNSLISILKRATFSIIPLSPPNLNHLSSYIIINNLFYFY